MFDFLYDQQDIYDYYREIFEEKANSMDGMINVRQPMQLFSMTLENFDMLLTEFSEEKDMLTLANLRWYIYSSNFDNYEKYLIFKFRQSQLNSSKMFVDDMNPINSDETIFSTTCTNTYSSKIIEDYQIKSSNNILCLLHSIVLTMVHFCKLSFQYIIKYQNDEKFFLDSIIKRYSSFVEAAIYINENLENINVVVNYLYETLFKDCPNNPKFSIYRLMIVIWHREVTTPLTDLKYKNNLISLTLKIFKRKFLSEINKIYNFDLRINKSNSDPHEIKEIKHNNECYSDSETIFAKDDYYNDFLGIGLGNNENFSRSDSKTLFLDDVYSQEYQTNYFLERYLFFKLESLSFSWILFQTNIPHFI